jgi:hypothetical protein
MDSAFGIQNTMLDSVVLLAGRLLLAWIFVHEGVFLATNFDAASAGMAKLGVPGLALIPTIALQLLAGIATDDSWDCSFTRIHRRLHFGTYVAWRWRFFRRHVPDTDDDSAICSFPHMTGTIVVEAATGERDALMLDRTAAQRL